MTKDILISPTMITVPRKTKEDKNVSLNLNSYRNMNHFLKNTIKKLYTEEMESQLLGLTFTPPIEIYYKVYFARRGRQDISNVCSIVDKFFCDALMHYECIPEDDYRNIPMVQYEFGGIDTKNPRVEVRIEELI